MPRLAICAGQPLFEQLVDKDCARRATESADGRCDGSEEFVVVVDRTDVTTIHCSLSQIRGC
jgi:hypothetical protein